MTVHWSNTLQGKLLIQKAFSDAGLPEVRSKGLPKGVYTNQKISEKCKTFSDLIALLNHLTADATPEVKREFLSLAVNVNNSKTA